MGAFGYNRGMGGPVITLLTDFGDRGGYPGIMKGVIYARHPAAAIVDLTHHVTPQAIREGAFLLHAAYRYFPPGTIHVAVVDPGVGTDRRAVCLDVPTVGRFLGPNNGIFSYILHAHPELTAREIANPAYLRRPVSPTFHGRDIFAPAAAALAAGAPLEAIGPPLDPAGLVRLPALWPEWEEDPARAGGRRLRGEVVHIDSFGNLVTTIPQGRFATLPAAQLANARVRTSPAIHECRGIAATYGRSAPGTVIALFGNSGFLEIARVNGRADEYARGERVPLGLAVEVRLDP